MPTVLITHPACLGHDAGEWHPESPDRLRRVLRVLEAERFSHLLRDSAPEATTEQLERVHAPDHVRMLLAHRPDAGDSVVLDADTSIRSGSMEAGLRAAGGAVAGVDAVLSGSVRAAFVAVRPPGHHAEPARAMGFCLFNNAAVGAAHALAHWGLERVAIVDFDVHHGNGTQAIFANDPRVFYASSHQSPCYPGTGHAWETGIAGNIVNAPLAPDSDGRAFRAAWAGHILPALRRFSPELLIVSAGFDAHKADPLAQLRLEVADFAWLTDELVAVADARCGGRIVSVLEGGYDLDALGASVQAHVRGLMRDPA